jgi:hypothetical protein
MRNNIVKTLTEGCSTAVRRAFLADELCQLREKPITQRRAASFVGVSVPYLIAAAKVAKDPVAKAAVLAGKISLIAAAKQASKPHATDVFEMADLFKREQAAGLSREDTPPRMPDFKMVSGKGHDKGNGSVHIHDLSR